MLTVFLCEDNSIQREKIEKVISDTILNYNLDLKKGIFSETPFSIIKYLENHKDCTGIYFLDIDLKSTMDGLELAKVIRNLDPFGYIIFVTCHYELSFMTFQYKVEAMDYIIKNNDTGMENKIKDCLMEAYNKYLNKKNIQYFSINLANRVLKIPFDEILFFETTETNRKIRIHGLNQQVEFYDSMKELEKKSNGKFYRTHRSYLVNLKNIKEVNKGTLTIYMVNDERCYVSSKYLKELLNKWI
ncbi:LytTR family DNA-binding domain-containing protein [Clostridium sp. FP2]|uniref:LytR/AlgR family response regulator transcription factor n=1 Tax=Clostridium sp. FP2 TaxID=2724481 RepID=UPI0013E9250B|nr:LytTR family DNA-binding domain-containing protein [Clostridium sp. FP2]MBZ9626159.1 LytTR family DNA-binding domain-containing protein [Clostridium sp. FP2]